MDILDLYNVLVDEKYGIISSCESVESYFGLPHIYRYIAEVNLPKVSEEYDVRGYGYAFTRRRAITKALGEGIERYSGALFDDNVSYCNLNQSVPLSKIDEQLLSFISSTFYRDNNTDDYNNWTWCDSLYGKEKLFPVFWIKYPSEHSALGSTSGMAAGCSEHDAKSRAVSECLERHICAEYWLNKTPAYKIRENSLNYYNRSIISSFKQSGIAIDLYYIHNEWQIPCYIARASNSDHKHFSNRPSSYIVGKVGAGDDLHVTSLLEELIGGYFSLCELCDDEKNSVRPLDSIEHLSAMHYSSKPIPIENISGETDLVKTHSSMLEIAINNRLPIYIKNITPCDVREINLFVYKAISPSLSQIHEGNIFNKGVQKCEGYYPFL